MGGTTIKNKIFIITAILITLFCLSCINAKDLNDADVELTLDPEADVEIPNDSPNSKEQTVLSNEESANNNLSAFLILDNDGDKENIKLGDLETWIISVLNMGPDLAKNVKVYDELPEGMSYISHKTTKGTFNPESGIWDIGNLNINDGETFLYITTKALTVGEKINKAWLTTDSINLNQNGSYEEEEIDVEVDDDDDSDKRTVSALTQYQTSNPIALILLSLFTILITIHNSKR